MQYGWLLGGGRSSMMQLQKLVLKQSKAFGGYGAFAEDFSAVNDCQVPDPPAHNPGRSLPTVKFNFLYG